MENLVYHYTTLEAMISIIGSDVCMWATRYDHLNDPHEQIWAKDIIIDYCYKNYEMKSLTLEEFSVIYAKFSYILSFCDIPDYRNMWRLYCNDGLGVCLAFDGDLLEEISMKNSFNDPSHCNDKYRHVYYSSKNEISNAVERLKNEEVFKRLTSELEEQFMNMCPFIKDDDFDIENEVRYARIKGNYKCDVFLNPDNVREIKTKGHEDKEGVKYRIRGNKEIIPYIEIHFPKETLKKVIVGYQYDFEDAKLLINSHLKRYSGEYDHVHIEPSLLK